MFVAVSKIFVSIHDTMIYNISTNVFTIETMAEFQKNLLNQLVDNIFSFEQSIQYCEEVEERGCFINDPHLWLKYLRKSCCDPD